MGFCCTSKKNNIKFNTKKYETNIYEKGLGIIFMLGGICLFSACEQDDLYLGKPVDESQYEGIYKDNSFAICDAQSGSQITVVELYNQDFLRTMLLTYVWN